MMKASCFSGILTGFRGLQKQGKAVKPSQEPPQVAKTIQEVQAQLDAVQEALKQAMAQLVEVEKGKVLKELEHAMKVADEADAAQGGARCEEERGVQHALSVSHKGILIH